MKEYDFDKAKAIIEKNKENVKSASLGINEDWFWTAETIYEDGEYTRELSDGTCIAGINGSGWGTPMIRIETLDGEDHAITCYKGESSGEKPSWLSLGVLSGPAQDAMPPLKEEM